MPSATAPSTMNARTAELVRHLNTTAIAHSAESYPGMHKLRSLRAAATLRDPFINEDTGFPLELRHRMGIRGLLPPAIETLDQQMARVLDQMRTKRTSIGQYIYLSNLRQSNVNLFYHVLLTNTSEVVPLVYTPVVGEACTKWSHIYQRPEGLYVSWNDRGCIRDVLKNWPLPEEARICVVTDGSRILGLGDLGIGGMGISVGKLSLYVAAAGIRPWATVPICIDLGTDNEKNLADPLYLGLRMKRRSKEEALEFMDEFMAAVHAEFPELVIQHEDFATERAFDYLKRYQHSYPMFNDDIQGTGAVILGGFINAARLSTAASGKDLRDQRIVFMGAGSAGVGVAKQLLSFFINLGFSEEEAKERVWLVDTKGLVTSDRGDKLAAHKTFFARQPGGPQIKTLIEVIKHVKPTALIGLAATANLFDEAVVKLMAELNPRPIIFPLSNPVHLAECTFDEAVKWTDGQVLFASGSPFASCGWRGQTIEPGQGNNMYVFPGIGLGAILARVKTISDKMIEASALALSDALTDEEKACGLLYPRLNRIRDISTSVALRVIRQAQEEGLVGNPVVGNLGDDELQKYIEQKEYWPAFMSGEHIDLAIRS
ncbi:hypothetical protein PTTG_02672 [Puccinia triticina 1-1 BBBD Race 1]|uniref:Malic enzyme n=2 Tax=Puccinia triticina TaxID=208348 RepID=A0A180GGM7_PUCT1|nr:uncharacterized protein PtA15_1A160 [Puccinia triticina]OAV91850.1 hypothetical protein PTTG_02672 [Puccinia triticina 1-1 BBBD Race 1]WAQ80822.1 hypothetical protein PtA15_1A160 [Puccinia triticina]